MRSIIKGVGGAIGLLLASAVHMFAVISNLEIQGTNLVLSWPSQGYEHYLIQYRPTLDPSTPWLSLTNNYPANSTNRTRFVIPCCALNDLTGMNGGSFAGNQAFGSSSAIADNSYSAVDPRLWARPKDGAGDAVPLSIYPPGFDTNTLFIWAGTNTTIATTGQRNRRREDFAQTDSRFASGNRFTRGKSNFAAIRD